MATLAELEDALRNADAAGDAQAARQLADAIVAARAAGQQQAQPSAPGPTAGQKLVRGMAEPIAGGAQLLTKMLPERVVNAGNELNNWLADKTGMVAKLPAGGVDEQVRTEEAAYEAQRKAAGDTGMDWWRLAGNVLSPANLAMAAATPAKLATLGQRMAAGSAAGLGSAALSPVTTDGNFAAEKGKQLLTGAATGGAVPLLAAGAGRLISPKASTNPDVALLRREGVRPTLGQTLGGFANATEEKLQSVPIMGDAIRFQRLKAQEALNRAAINRAGEPIGVSTKEVGSEGVRAVGDQISDAFESGKRALGAFQLDRQAASELTTLRNMANNLPDRELKAFDKVWSLLDREVSPNGHITAEGFRRFDSKSGLEASRFKGSQDAYQKEVGDAILELQRIVLDAGERAKPAASEELRKAKAAFANLVRVENAATRAANQGGVFTPGQLGMAVRSTDQSVRDRATARGTALMQDLSTAGQNVLGNKIADSGTPTRLMYGMGGLGAGFIDPSIPLGLLGGASLYSTPMQRLLAGSVTKRPQAAKAIAGLLDQSSPMLAPAGGLLGIEFAQ